MKTWIQRTLLSVFGASMALGALTACGHREGMRQGWSASAEDRAQMRERVIGRIASKLELNDDQKKKLGVVADRLQAQRTALMGQADPRTQLQQVVAGEKFDRVRAQAMVSEKTAALNTGSPELIAALGDFYDSLTPAQQAKVREAMQRRRGWWHRG